MSDLFEQEEVETPPNTETPAVKSVPKVEPTVLAGDDIPEAYRGKSAAEVIKELEVLRESNEEFEKEKEKEKESEHRSSAAHNPPADPNKPMTVEELQELSYRDPLKAMTIIVQAANRPIVEEFRTMSERIAKSDVKKQKDYSRFEKEVEGVMAKMDPRHRSNPEAWTQALNMIRGQNVETLIKESVQGSTAPGGNANPLPAPQKVVLTDEQKDVARKLNMTEEQYIEGL